MMIVELTCTYRRPFRLQFNDSIPYHLKAKPLYGNIVDVSLTTYKCTIVTWPPPQRSVSDEKYTL